jgi:hypothetical protein
MRPNLLLFDDFAGDQSQDRGSERQRQAAMRYDSAPPEWF